jgi:mono/diheme cytochrome c family protein
MTIRSTFVALAVCALGALGALPLAAQAPSAPTSGPTFSKDVAPILYKNCTSCHRPGEIAPMSLLTYKDARPWAKSISTRVANGTMPPWHADASTGPFLNDRSLSDADKGTIAKWVAAGAPEGNPADPIRQDRNS